MLNKLTISTAIGSILLASNVYANKITTNTAVLQAMDKITGKVSVIEVPVNGEVKFGSFSIVARTCQKTPPEETPENYAFIDVVDNYSTKKPVNIFRGWMMSSTPGLNAINHPIYDVWLLKCINSKVNTKKLLSEQELKARDEIAKVTVKKPAEDNIKSQSAKVEVAVEKDALATEVIDNGQVKEETVAPKIEDTIKNKANNIAKVVKTEAKDGAPKSLLNINNDVLEQQIEAEDTKAPTALPTVTKDKKITAEVSIVQSINDEAVAEKNIETPNNSDDKVVEGKNINESNSENKNNLPKEVKTEENKKDRNDFLQLIGFDEN